MGRHTLKFFFMIPTGTPGNRWPRYLKLPASTLVAWLFCNNHKSA